VVYEKKMLNDKSRYLFLFGIIFVFLGIFLFWMGYMNLDVGFFEGPFNMFYFIIMLIGLISVVAGLLIIILLKKNKEKLKTKIILMITIIIIFLLLILPIIYETFFITRIIM